MGDVILISFFLLSAASILYLMRHQIRRWWRNGIANRNLPPHQRWPEILQWRKGDEFEEYPYHCCRLVPIESDGYAVLEFLEKRQYAHLSRLVGHNASARTRRINKRLAESGEYMELLEEFNKAVAELEARDRQLKRVS